MRKWIIHYLDENNNPEVSYVQADRFSIENECAIFLIQDGNMDFNGVTIPEWIIIHSFRRWNEIELVKEGLN